MFFNSKKNNDGNILSIIDYAKTNIFANEILWITGITLGIIGSVTSSIWLVSYFVYNPEYIDDKNKTEETEYNKYISFINKDYETFIQIYKDNNEQDYSTATENCISELNKKENHQTVTLPYSYNSEMKFFYNDENKYFYYYSKTDVNSKILNSVCRSYTLRNKCLHLFKDDEEILYMKNESKRGNNNSTPTLEPNDSLIEPVKQSEDDENADGFVNIFYKKKNRNNNKNNPLQQSTNHLLYKGTLLDYEKEYSIKPVQKYTSYKEYLQNLED